MSLIGVSGPKGNVLSWLDSMINIRIEHASECDPFSSMSSLLCAANFSRVLFPDMVLCQGLGTSKKIVGGVAQVLQGYPCLRHRLVAIASVCRTSPG